MKQAATQKVLVSDNLGEAGIELFVKAPGIAVDVRPGLGPEQLEAIIGDYDGLAIRSATKVTAKLLGAAKRLKVVGRAGIGLDNVDIGEATRRGIIVMNTPAGNVVTTAEHAIALMMALTRNIPQGTATLKAGLWEKKRLQGREISGKVLGVIGFGKIGSIVADRARGLKMTVVVYDPFVTADRIEKAGFTAVGLADLYRQADYITVHVPKLKDTAGMVDAGAFGLMKPGVMVINCARGGIIDEDALYDALVSGKVAGAALDVFVSEPPGAHRLLALEQVIATPHLGASTLEAQTNVAVQVAEQIIAYLSTGTIINAVNAPSVTGELLTKLGPYLALAEQMGCLQAQLISGPITEVNLTFAGDFQGLDLSPVTLAALKGLLTAEVQDVVNFVNAAAIAKGRGIKITETVSDDAEGYINQISMVVTTNTMTNRVAGTIFGKSDPRIIKINHFRLELVPCGHLALIYNLDKPGAIGSIGTCLGKHNINIGRMQVGQEEGGDRNIIFLSTDIPIPVPVLEELRALPMVRTVTPLEFPEQMPGLRMAGCPA
jgi:D-3-phosphoglycerate dehydrogenase